MTTHETATRYPLTWPTGWKRTGRIYRQPARFRNGRQQLTVAGALDRLQVELDRLGATDEVLSTNVRVRIDGLPRSGEKEPDDPGAAVYFRLKGQPRCLACDKWDRVADNIAAIAAHIEAIRAVDRYGVGTLDQAFAGYAALPEVARWPPGRSRNSGVIIMQHEIDTELLNELLAAVEVGWRDRHDRTVAYRLAEAHPEYRDQLLEFFEDLVLGADENVSADVNDAENRVSQWIQTVGVGAAVAGDVFIQSGLTRPVDEDTAIAEARGGVAMDGGGRVADGNSGDARAPQHQPDQHLFGGRVDRYRRHHQASGPAPRALAASCRKRGNQRS